MSEWLSGNVSMHDPSTGKWRVWKLPGIHGRPGEVWLPESGTEHISVIRNV